jgi:hypothetical protein
VALQVSSGLEAVVAEVADEVVAFVDAPDVVVQVRTPFELLAAPGKKEMTKTQFYSSLNKFRTQEL